MKERKVEGLCLIFDYGGYPFIRSLSRSLSKNGLNVMYLFVQNISNRITNLEKNAQDPESFQIHNLKMSRWYSAYKYSFFIRFLLELHFCSRAFLFMLRSRPKVVIVCNMPSVVQFSVWLGALLSGARFISWVQDLYGYAVYTLLERKLFGLGFLGGKALIGLDNFVLRHSDHVVGISAAFKEYFLNVTKVRPERISIIHNWAPLEKIPSLSKKNGWSQRFGLDDSFVFLYSGTLGLKHNPSSLIELAKGLSHLPDVLLVVVSEGRGKEFLRTEAAKNELKNLRLFDLQSESLYPEILASADVLITLLERDAGKFSVPSKVSSYLCAERAQLMIGPKMNLASQILLENECGLVVDSGDAAHVLKSALLLYEDRELRSSMAVAGRRYAEQEFEIENVLKKFERVVSEF